VPAPVPRWCAIAILIAWACGAGCTPPPRLPDSISISVPYEISSLDPHVKNTVSDFAIASQFYEPLVGTDASMQLHPCLARLWENPDPSTWLFHLQGRARFHDGRPLRAQDVVFSIRRLLDTPGLEMTGYALHIKEVVAEGPLAVRIRTTSPVSVLLNKLRFVLVVPEGSTAAALAATPNGTGPYSLAERSPEGTLRLVRNEGYWGALPRMRRVEFLLNRQPEQALSDLLTGRCQLVQLGDKRLQESLGAQSHRIELLRRPNIFLKYIGFDLAHEVTPYTPVRPNPFRNRLVRQAMHLGLDRSRLVQGLSSEAIPAREPVPPAIFGFNPQIPDPGYDLEKARQLLREAGLPAGLPATLHVRKIFAEAAHLVSAQLRAVGFDLSVRVLDDPEFFELAKKRGLSLFLSRFGCPTGDASDVLDNAFHSTDAGRRVGVQNYAGFASPEVDRAIEESAAIESIYERRVALEQIMQMLMDELVWVPLYVDQDVYAIDRAFSWQPRSDSFVLAAEITPREER
jgi:peptide/nickel transport system substrate-binding protein